MKNKIYKHKRYLLKRSRRELKKTRSRKNRTYTPINLANAQAYYVRKQQIFKPISFPKKLTLEFEDAPSVLNWIRKIKKVANEGYFIDFSLDDVQEIGDGSISMLLSVMSDLTHKGVFFRGNKPKNEQVKDDLERSGFFRHIIGSVAKKNRSTKNTILTTGTLNTHQKELVPEIHKAMETIWGVESRCPILYAGLGEMMRNTCDHAFANSKNIRWHLGIRHNEEENTVNFSFVDNGEYTGDTNPTYRAMLTPPHTGVC